MDRGRSESPEDEQDQQHGDAVDHPDEAQRDGPWSDAEPGHFPEPVTVRRLRSSSPLPTLNTPDLVTADQAREIRIERDDPLLTVTQAGDYLGTGERFVRRLMTQRRITYIKIGLVRLPRSALDAFIEAGRVLGEEPPR